MLYTYKPAGQESANTLALLAVSVGNSFFGMTDVLAIPSVITTLSNYSVTCNIKAIDGIPLVITNPLQGQSADFSSVLTACMTRSRNEFPPELCTQLAEKYKEVGIMTSVEEVTKVIDYVYEMFLPYLRRQKSVPVKTPPLFFVMDDGGVTKRVVDEINASIDPSTRYLGNTTNETKFQTTPYDILSWELPSYTDFRNPEIPTSSYIPSPQDMFRPWKHQIYLTPLWQKIIDQPASSHASILSVYSGELGIKAEDLIDIPIYPLEDILGSVDNNDKDIQDNEIDMYEKLVRFIRTDTEMVFGQDAEDLNSLDGLSPNMREYVNGMIRLFAAINWACSGKLPMDIADDLYSDDDDDRGDDNVDDMSNGTEADFSTWPEFNPSKLDGFELLLGYIKECATHAGCEVYAEAIIKLARWGELKPRCLVLKGCDVPFDMSTFDDYIEPMSLDSLSVAQVNGRDFDAFGVIDCEGVVSDVEFLNRTGIPSGNMSMEVGIMCYRNFTNGKSQIVYMSIVDIVSEYLKGNYFINGIDYNGHGFIVDESKIDSSLTLNECVCNVRSSADGRYTHYYNSALSNFCQDIGCKIRKITDLPIISVMLSKSSYLSDYYEDVAFANVEELEAHVRELAWEKARIAETNIGYFLLQILLKAAALPNPDGDMSVLLNNTKKAMDELNIGTVTDFFGKLSSGGNTYLDRTMKHLSSFGAAPATEEKSPVVEEAPVAAPITAPALDVLLYPLDAKDSTLSSVTLGSDVVLYLTQKAVGNSKLFILISKEEAESGGFNISTASASVIGLTHFVYATLNHILVGHPERSTVKFHSTTSLSTAAQMLSANFKTLGRYQLVDK